MGTGKRFSVRFCECIGWLFPEHPQDGSVVDLGVMQQEPDFKAGIADRDAIILLATRFEDLFGQTLMLTLKSMVRVDAEP